MNREFRILLVLPLIALATPSLAQPDADRLAERLMEADADGNGAVSRTEMAQWRRSQWTRMDRNNDGFFSREDLPRFARSKWEKGRPAELRQRFDANRDGRVSRAEFLGSPMALFDRVDRNGDNLVTRVEIELATAIVASHRSGK